MVPGPKPLSRAVDEGRALVPGPKPLCRAVDEGRALVPGPKPLSVVVDLVTLVLGQTIVEAIIINVMDRYNPSVEQLMRLRNKVNAQIKRETIDFNNNRIDEARDENEVWKVAKDIIIPMKDNNWSMNVNNNLTDDPALIAHHFNTYFVKK